MGWLASLSGLSFLLACLLGFALLWLISSGFGKFKVKRGAKTVLAQHKAVYAQEHVYREVSPSEFPRLDHAFYDNMQRQFEALGFKFIADVEDVTVAEAFGGAKCHQRMMIGDGGRVAAVIFHFKPGRWTRLMNRILDFPTEARVIDLQTELRDGSFITTSNCAAMNKTGDVPGIHRTLMEAGTSVEDLLKVQRHAMACYEKLRPESTPLRLSNLDQLIASGNRSVAVKGEHKKSFGYIDKEEMQRIADGKCDEAVDALSAEIEKMKEKASQE